MATERYKIPADVCSYVDEENGILKIVVPFKDPMEKAVSVAIH